MKRILALALIVSSLACQRSVADPMDWSGIPTTAIDPGLVDNRGDFTGAFFNRYPLQHAPQPLQLNEQIKKDYYFPTFYGNVTSAVAMFYCSYDKAKALLPGDNMQPVSMGRGRALLICSSYHYGKVLGIPTYNEVALTIPVVVGRRHPLPIWPLIRPGYKGLGYRVISMPVTSLENQIRGVKIWGLPKVVQQIELSGNGEDFVTRVHEATGETYLMFRVPMKGKKVAVDQNTELYSSLNGQRMEATAHTNGNFVSTEFPLSLITNASSAAPPYIFLGDSPSGRALKELEIRPCPFQVRFGSDVSSAFELPRAFSE